MTDMPEWRRWADRAYSSLRVTTKSRSLFKCSGCVHRLTLRQAKLAGWDCTHCGAPLRAKDSRRAG